MKRSALSRAYVLEDISTFLIEISLHKKMSFTPFYSQEDKLFTLQRGHPDTPESIARGFFRQVQGSTSSECLHWAHRAYLKAEQICHGRSRAKQNLYK